MKFNVSEKGYNKLTPRCRVLLEKLIVAQLVNKFPAFTTIRHLALS
jgi:hypothetical protein